MTSHTAEHRGSGSYVGMTTLERRSNEGHPFCVFQGECPRPLCIFLCGGLCPGQSGLLAPGPPMSSTWKEPQSHGLLQAVLGSVTPLPRASPLLAWVPHSLLGSHQMHY